MIKSFHYHVIDHDQQRYSTTGDWLYDASTQSLRILVSDMGDWRFNLLVGIHELIEAVLCIFRHIPQESITAFDEHYERLRGADSTTLSYSEAAMNARITDTSEPGDDPAAPYHNPHCIATSVERMLCALLGVSWYDYEEANLQLYANQAPANSVGRA